MNALGQIPSSGYNPVRVSLDPNDPDYLKKMGLIGAVEGHHELNQPDTGGNVAGPTGTMQDIPTMGQQPKQRGVLGKIGHGLEVAGNIAGDIFAPGTMSLIPGTQLYKERQQTKQFGQEMERERQAADTTKAGAEETAAGAAQQRAATEAEKQAWAENNPAGPKLKEVTQDAQGNAIGVFEDGTTKPLGFQGQPPKEINDAYHYWLASHPNGTYDEFLKDTQQYKGNARLSGLGAYALGRVIDAAARFDPRLEALIPALAAELGVNAQGLDLSGAPPGQPRSDTGEPIGLAQPGAPTGATRTRGQFAESAVTDQVTGLKQEINNLRDQLGPVAGRWNEFIAGQVGADNPQFTGLRTGLTNLATAWMRLHANSETARQDFEQILARAKSPDNLIAALDAIDKQARDYVRIGKGNQPGGGAGAPPPGAKIITLDDFLKGK